MSLLLVLCNELLFGEGGWIWVFFAVALSDVSLHWILRLHQARRLHPRGATG
jgi:hypothetical protein